MTAPRLSDEELAQLELAGTSAAEDIAEYTTRRGTPTYDDRRVGRMMARESWVALAPRLIAEVRHYRALMGNEDAIIDHMAEVARRLEPDIAVNTRAWVLCEGGTVTTLSDWIRKQARKSRAALAARSKP